MSGEKQSKTMLDRILATPSARQMIERGLLPESCELHLEVALSYAGKSAEGDVDALGVVIEHLKEIKSKIKEAREE